MPLFQDGECPPLQRWSESAQIAGFMACCVLGSLTVGLIFFGVGVENALQDACRNGYTSGIVSALLRAVFKPFFETIIAQWLPIFFMTIVKKPVIFRIGFSSALYALLHLTDGLVVTAASLINGWILASAFVFCQRTGWAKALRVVSIASALQNVILLLIYLLMMV